MENAPHDVLDQALEIGALDYGMGQLSHRSHYDYRICPHGTWYPAYAQTGREWCPECYQEWYARFVIEEAVARMAFENRDQL